MKLCSSCKHFDCEEYYTGEDEIEVFICKKGNQEEIGWNTEPCKDYEEEKQ